MKTAATKLLDDRLRTLLAIMIVGSIAGALITTSAVPAESASVTVTARIAPVFSLSLLSQAQVDFGEVEIGNLYRKPGAALIEVRSNRTWEFIDSSDTALIAGELTLARSMFLRHSTSLPFGSDRPAGVHRVVCDYTLDLTPVEAFDLPPDTSLTTMFGYTAVQK